MDLRIALSPVVLSCLNMRRTPARPPSSGACHKRRNDDCGSSFRNRDNARARNPPVRVKSLFNRLNPLQEQESMKATIYHNPMCGTSRKTLEILRDSGCDVWVREYLKDPPSKDELERLYERAGISPREGLRSKEPLAGELGLTRPDVTDDELLDAMIAHPVLIERPIVETSSGVRLCRPQDKVREIL
jgi:arsenate reductase (glutaredoxin)